MNNIIDMLDNEVIRSQNSRLNDLETHMLDNIDSYWEDYEEWKYEAGMGRFKKDYQDYVEAFVESIYMDQDTDLRIYYK